jgi:hypothetical protein
VTGAGARPTPLLAVLSGTRPAFRGSVRYFVYLMLAYAAGTAFLSLFGSGDHPQAEDARHRCVADRVVGVELVSWSAVG